MNPKDVLSDPVAEKQIYKQFEKRMTDKLDFKQIFFLFSF
jgi:hypothetical protein